MNLEEVYLRIKKERGGIASIHSAFEKIPDGIEAHYDFYQRIFLDGTLPLSRFEREFLAVETSKNNECSYCIGHHEEALKNQVYPGEEEIEKPKREALRTLAGVLTKEPYKACVLKSSFLKAGYGEAEFQHAVFVVSYFNFANRLAHAMELELEEDFKTTCS